jgi:hypothetical protein
MRFGVRKLNSCRVDFCRTPCDDTADIVGAASAVHRHRLEPPRPTAGSKLIASGRVCQDLPAEWFEFNGGDRSQK